MKCPVCAAQDIPQLATHCPSCGTDLVQLMLFDDLEEQYIDTLKRKIATEGSLLQLQKEAEKKETINRSRIFRLWLMVLLLPVVAWWYAKKTVPPPPCTDGELQSLNARIAGLQHDLQMAETQRVRQIRYVIRPGDNLIGLGQLFFNNPQAGYQIGRDNHIDDESNYRHLPPGDTLFINFR